MADPVFWFHKDKTINTKQRSLINLILRKNLGDARFSGCIFEHGVPSLLDPPFLRQPPKRALLEYWLERFMTWHTSLLQWLVERKQDPNTIIARSEKSEARQRLSQGAHLATIRDSGKKQFNDMSATEQQVLVDFDANKLQKRHEELRVQKPEPFRRKLL